MIRTTNEIYNTRNNGVSRIYIEISEEVNDTDAEAFLFNVRDYIFEAGVKNNQYKTSDYELCGTRCVKVSNCFGA